MRWLFLLLLLGGCLEYDVVVETEVTEAGTIKRAIRIREKSDRPKTWQRYAPPREPYVLSGDEREGFVAKAEFEPGRHASGLRVVAEEIEGEYAGREPAEKARAFEGSVRVTVDDLIFGKLYTYRETIDLGLDPVKFRAEFDFALELGLHLLVAELEILEPDLDFAPVKEEAYRTVLPLVKSSLLAIHGQLVQLSESGVDLDGDASLEQLLDDPHVAIILAELGKLGLRRKKDAPQVKTLDEYLTAEHWDYDDELFRKALAPLKGVSGEKRAQLIERLKSGDGEIHQKGVPTLQEKAWSKVVPPAKQPYFEKRLEEFAVAGAGTLVVQNLFDTHRIRVRVRLPGKPLLASGALHGLPWVEWKIEAFHFANPRFFARSFLPNEKMVGHIADLDALFRYAEALKTATKVDREVIERYLKIAREEGFDAAKKKTRAMVEAMKPLRDALAGE